jgi:hypothetical protein
MSVLSYCLFILLALQFPCFLDRHQKRMRNFEMRAFGEDDQYRILPRLRFHALYIFSSYRMISLRPTKLPCGILLSDCLLDLHVLRSQFLIRGILRMCRVCDSFIWKCYPRTMIQNNG